MEQGVVGTGQALPGGSLGLQREAGVRETNPMVTVG